MTGPGPRPFARLAATPADLAACRRLRDSRFRGGAEDRADPHDAVCDHLMIEVSGRLTGTLRALTVPDGRALDRTLTAQSYDLRPLAGVRTPVMEVGRLCIAPGAPDAEVLRCLLGALADLVRRDRIGLLIGCTSFAGADPARHAAGLRLLGRDHQGPKDLQPRARAAEVVDLDGVVGDRRSALRHLPPLLRSYLAMGGWVGPQAVVDRGLDTLHVFTCVEVARIPVSRARALLALAG